MARVDLVDGLLVDLVHGARHAIDDLAQLLAVGRHDFADVLDRRPGLVEGSLGLGQERVEAARRLLDIRGRLVDLPAPLLQTGLEVRQQRLGVAGARLQLGAGVLDQLLDAIDGGPELRRLVGAEAGLGQERGRARCGL